MTTMRSTRLFEAQDLGSEVRRRRQLLGMTQEELGDILGFSARLVGDIERGKGGVAFEKILLISEELGIRLYAEAGETLSFGRFNEGGFHGRA